MRRFHCLFKQGWYSNESKQILFDPRRGLKFSADIKWVAPVREPVYHPQSSGDLEAVEVAPPNTIKLAFQNSEELKNASDSVKKIFSLEYLPKKYSSEIYQQQLIDRVKQNAHDDYSLEVKIAKYTAKIRFHQPFLMDPKVTKKVKNKTKVITKELIDKRKMLLKALRANDYKRFEWVLEKLNLVYKPTVMNDTKITRKKSLTLLAKLRTERAKEEKLGKLKKALDEQKVPFLEKKIDKLKWIKEMEIKSGLPPSVTDEDISECVKMLEKVKIEIAEKLKRGYIRKIHPYLLEPYDEKLLEEKEQGKMSNGNE